MPEHKFRFGTALFVKPSIFEADLFDEAAQRELPELAELLLGEALAGPLAERLPELRLAAGPGARSVKLQHNAGAGGCFPLHYDNAGPPSRRALTCVVYMNPGWRPGDGGELELRPFLRPAVLVPPLMGRAALFRSDRVLHRVRPSSAERLCFTVWVDGEAVNGSGDCGLTARHLAAEPGALEAFARSPVQRAVSRAVYAEEYEASLRECMERRPGELEEMLQEHRRHVAQQRAHAQLGPFLGRLGALRAQLEGAAGAEAEGQGPD
ncbi:unnamed protein product [Prorocentrum cordatum]|uniref:Fe2OG dioxygenase domain-containing protein n=1 Tax=Prorocentrum cordatum TaxID=2364126 RepID=A0ABN9U3Z8_9DINO|nr:unnamed protein product [Polarella glacialis]